MEPLERRTSDDYVAMQFRTFPSIRERVKVLVGEKGLTMQDFFEAMLLFVLKNKESIRYSYDSQKGFWEMKLTNK